MTIFEQNIAELSKRYGDASILLEAAEEEDDIEILPTPEGNPTITIHGKYLHSRHAPLREARRLAESLLREDPGFILLIGMGLGYAAEQICSLGADIPLYIVIPRISVFKTLLHHKNLTPLFQYNQLTLIFEPEPGMLLRIISREGRKSFSFLANRGIQQIFPEYCRAVSDSLKQYRGKQEINTNTLIRFGETWVKNVIQNLSVLESSRDISRLRKTFGSIPKLLLAAGPSVDTLRPVIHEIRKRCLIIAVDTTAGFCSSAGIEPDFLVVVDPQYWNTRHLDRAVPRETFIVSEPSTHPRTFRLCAGPVFMGGSVFPLGMVLEEAMGRRHMLGAGGSVATTAWDFAGYIGDGPIYCAGLDLGFPGKQTHFTGSYFETRSHYLSGRLSPGETLQFTYLYGGGTYCTKAAGGGTVLTDRRLAVYARWFERQLSEQASGEGGAKSFLLSGEGTEIKGMDRADISDLLELPLKRDAIDSILAEMKSAGSPVNRKQIRAAFQQLRRDLDQMTDTAERGISLSRSLLRAEKPDDVKSILHKLETVDREISDSPIKEIAGFLLQKTAREIAESGTPGENSLKLYGDLKKSIEFHTNLIDKVLKSE